MSVKTIISSPDGAVHAGVTNRGELIVGDIAFSSSYNATAGTDNVAANILGPLPNQQFVITGIVLYANKNVGVNDATVVIYEATSESSTTVVRTVFTTEMLKQSRVIITGVKLLVPQGVWLNVKTDDDDVFSTVLGYYVPTVV